MSNLEEILYQKIKSIMLAWDEEDIYAVSFFVEANMAFSYRNCDNVSGFAVSYNTESDCENAGPHAEERWNYAFWRQDEIPIIEPVDDSVEMALLFDWYQENRITNIGENLRDGENGPVGFKELVGLAAKVARRFQDEGFLREKFGRPIPIIIHDLEYTNCTKEATEYANPNGEAADFLHGSWEGEPAEFSLSPNAAAALAANILNDPKMLERLATVSPGFSKDELINMLKKLSG